MGHTLDEFYRPGTPAAQLAAAAARGDTAAVADAVRRGADPNAAGREGMTPLAWAVMAQNEVGLRALLQAGADPNRRNADGVSALGLVAGAPDPRWLALFLAHGGDPNARTRRDEPLLFQAIRQRNLGAVRMLAEHGADLNGRGVGGDTPLLLAGTLNQFEIVRYLLERGADWRLTDPSGVGLAYTVDDARVDPQFRDKYAAEQWARAFLTQRGVRFPMAKPWEQRAAERPNDARRRAGEADTGRAPGGAAARPRS